MCKTKPIRNQRKVRLRLRLNRPFPSLRVENEAKGRELTLHAPGSTLHASPPPWPVNLEGVAGGERRQVTVKTANRSVANRRKRSAGRRKMCKTKPKIHRRKGLV